MGGNLFILKKYFNYIVFNISKKYINLLTLSNELNVFC